MIRAVIQRKIAWAAFTGFFFVSVFGVFCFGMQPVMDMNTGIPMGKVHTAILSCMDTQNNVCAMSIANHIDQWELALLGISQPPSASVFALAVLLMAGAIIRLQRTRREELWRHRLRLQRWRSVLLRPFDSILSAFSQGILHSQIYA